jgi:hypothetical protein
LTFSATGAFTIKSYRIQILYVKAVLRLQSVEAVVEMEKFSFSIGNYLRGKVYSRLEKGKKERKLRKTITNKERFWKGTITSRSITSCIQQRREGIIKNHGSG